jgi:hypothetical protein
VTDLLVRTPDTAAAEPSAGIDAPRSSSPVVGGALAATCAALIGLVFVEVVVGVLGLGDGRSQASVPEVLRVGAAIWLLAHGSALHLADGSITLVPLGLTALAAILLHRAGRRVARRVPESGRRAIPGVAIAVAVPYAVVVALLAIVVRTSGLRPSVPRGGIGALLLALAAAGLGAAGVLAPDRLAFLRRGGRVLRFSGPEPTATRVVARAALVACGVLTAGAAAVAGTSIALHLPAASELARNTHGGVLGYSGVLVVQLALLPNLLVWFLGYLAGPGFSVGSETSVSLFDPHLGEVPALPMFAGLPGQVALPVLLAVGLIPLLAGGLAGRVVLGRRGMPRLRLVVLSSLAVGPVTGVLVAAAVAIGSGRVLGGGLAEIGASAWRTGLAVAIEVGLLTLVTAVGLRGWRSWRDWRGWRGWRGPVAAEPDAGTHRPADPGTRRRWLSRPYWLHRPGLPGRPRWLRRRRKVVQLPD